MSKFRVGDRVRVKASRYPSHVGAAATIVGIGGATQTKGADCEIEIDGIPSFGRTGWWSARFEWLEPLTPPKEWADAKVRDLLKPQYIEPVCPSVEVIV